MKAYEFPAQVTPEGKLEFPKALLKSLPFYQQVRVIVLVQESTDKEEEENAAWSRLSAEQFFADNGKEDDLYDKI